MSQVQRLEKRSPARLWTLKDKREKDEVCDIDRDLWSSRGINAISKHTFYYEILLRTTRPFVRSEPLEIQKACPYSNDPVSSTDNSRKEKHKNINVTFDPIPLPAHEYFKAAFPRRSSSLRAVAL